MKKLALAVTFLVAGGVAAWAQAPSNPWTWQLQGGYNTSSKWMDSGWNASTGVGYAFSDHFKLDFDLGYLEGKVKDTDVKDHLWTFMVAPEYTYNISDSDQFYALVGAGVARRDSKVYTLYAPGAPQFVGIPGESKFAAEAGLGYRHFFTKNVGLSLQATYTYMDFQNKTEPVDGRVGLVVRF